MKSVPHLAILTLLAFALAPAARAGQIGRDGDLHRTGWYADQSGLSPSAVTNANFGQLFSTALNGQVYAQPLVYNGTLLVVTEGNGIYGLDPATGAIQWSRVVGPPWNSSDLGCTDLYPVTGITATPVIDDSTGIAYFTSKQYASVGSTTVLWKMHAISVATGVEQAGFPVTLSGHADNASGEVFLPDNENQRPGLLLLNGVVYAAFSALCDIPPFQGWVFGVSTSGAVTARWCARTGNNDSGCGIWMSGSGLVTDGPGQILLVTGNGMGSTTYTPAPGTSPPADLGEAVVRLAVQANGTLKATDFFVPDGALNNFDPPDADLGSGGLVELPSSPFGTAAYPNLDVTVGKPGVIYVLDPRSLGGYDQGPGHGDAVVQEIAAGGAVWSKPAVWGGDGGWIYFPTAAPPLESDATSGLFLAYQAGLDGTGKPTLVSMASSADSFGFSSSAPIVTSNGSTSGSALVWIIWNPDYTGDGSELRAYDPVPVGGVLHLHWSAPIGTGPKFSPPGVYANRLYVGTRDNHVLGFGVLSGAGVAGVGAPRSTRLSDAHPNPAARGTSFELALARSGEASLAIYDTGGRRVRSLLGGETPAGSRTIAWDMRDDAGARVPAGLYFARLEAGSERQTRRVLVLN